MLEIRADRRILRVRHDAFSWTPESVGASRPTKGILAIEGHLQESEQRPVLDAEQEHVPVHPQESLPKSGDVCAKWSGLI